MKFENVIRKTLSEINPIINTLDSLIDSDLVTDSTIPKNNLVNVNVSAPGINIDFPFNDEGINAAITLLNSLKISNKIN